MLSVKVMKMNNIKENSFKKIYITFFTVVTLICVSFIMFILNIDSLKSSTVINVTLIFVLSIFFLAILFIYLIRKKILNVFGDLDEIIDSAINEEKIITGYDETMLSALESKLFRYIKITKANKEAVENERNKVKTLVSDISHQTKTPIANILLYSQLILENEQIDDYSKEILQDIKKQSERLNFLIQSLIKMSRLESGIIILATSKIKIKDVILKSIQKIYINAQGKEIDVNISCDENIMASFDIKWTVEALVNILENSIKYTKVGGKIDIRVTSYELFKRIDIKDNGIGIDEEEINNIFKRFYRCKNVNQYEGVGIGLYLTREIISIQGGYIKVSSEIKQGTTMSVFLPS
ncbi:sensor histidine kinase [Romboutsia maritimum]|uniref:histidine kinase n=2 Tax=Romboutsia maritimum TaxID=2020948 RepID=A0A371IRW2_9FIRM|nr:sensor histidine kinase [Romboutsia maritimum]